MWSRILPDDIVAGSDVLIDLTMTKFLAPNVTIAYELRVENTAVFVDGFESGDTLSWSDTSP